MNDEIESKKKELIKKVRRKDGNFLNLEVQKTSKELDELIIKYIKENQKTT
ncbi:aspartyl-phosphate phosphatase Spo0E family protein [Halanaerobaculum tunisiense]